MRAALLFSLLLGVAIAFEAADKTLVGQLDGSVPSELSHHETANIKPLPRARSGEPSYVYSVHSIPRRAPEDDPVHAVIEILRRNPATVEAELIFDSDILCNCTLPGCDQELVEILGDKYTGMCRSQGGVCRRTKASVNGRVTDSMACVALNDLQPSEMPFYCNPTNDIAIACCASGSFCNNKLNPRKRDGSEVTAVFEHPFTNWVVVVCIILGFVFFVACFLFFLYWKFPQWRPSKLRQQQTPNDASQLLLEQNPVVNVKQSPNGSLATAVSASGQPGLLAPPGQSAELGSSFVDSGSGRKNDGLDALLHDLNDIKSGEDSGSGSGTGNPYLAYRTVARQVRLTDRIGQGRFGEVWEGIYKGSKVAVKIVQSRDERSWNHEWNMYNSELLRHPNILRVIACDNKDTGMALQLWIVMEYLERGSLFDFLCENAVDQKTALAMLRDIAAGLSFLHMVIVGSNSSKPQMAHRDLKSRNILVRHDGGCVIGDLGLAVRCVNGTLDIHDKKCGTVRYLSPEMLDSLVDPTLQSARVHSMEGYIWSDMYAFALVAWELAQRTKNIEGVEPGPKALPYEEWVSREPRIEEMREVVCAQGRRPPLHGTWQHTEIMRAFAEVMQDCWTVHPDARRSSMNVRIFLENVCGRHGIRIPGF